MSNTFNISQMLGMAGMTITRTQVKVSAVFDRRTGEGQYGPYSFQDGKIEDETGTMKITFSNLPDQRSLAGRTMIFKSMETKKGLHGVQAKSREYKGKPDISLVISKVALIVGAEENENNISAVTPSTRMPQNEPVEASEAPIRHEDRKLGIATAKNRLTQLAGLYDLCWKTVEGMELRDQIIEETELMDPGLRKDIATTLFIQSVREGLADKMPVRTTEKFYKEGGQDHPEHANQEEPAQEPF